MNYLAIYKKMIITACRAQLEYPKVFIIGVVSQWMAYGAQFFANWILIQSFGNLNGWRPLEVLLLYSLQLVTYAVSASFVSDAMGFLPDIIRSGEFDSVLTKPVNSLGYLIYMNFNIGYIGHISLSIIVIIICWVKLGLGITFFNIISIIVTIIGGSMITAGIMIICEIPSLFIIGENLIGKILYDLRAFTNFPLSIYNLGLQIFFTFIIPYGFINFYPAQYYLNKSEGVIFHEYFEFLPVFVGTITLSLAIIMWNNSIKR